MYATKIATDIFSVSKDILFRQMTTTQLVSRTITKRKKKLYICITNTYFRN